MDVKSAILNCFINEEVYVEHPLGFEDPNLPNHVFKLSNALYGLKEAPRAWYARLSKFLIEKGFNKGKVDTTLFIKVKGNDILIVKHTKKGTFINQAKYVKDLFKRFRMDNSKPYSTPMSTSTKLDKDE